MKEGGGGEPLYRVKCNGDRKERRKVCEVEHYMRDYQKWLMALD